MRQIIGKVPAGTLGGVALLFVAACATSRGEIGVRPTDAEMEQWKGQATTRNQIRRAYGPPPLTKDEDGLKCDLYAYQSVLKGTAIQTKFCFDAQENLHKAEKRQTD